MKRQDSAYSENDAVHDLPEIKMKPKKRSRRISLMATNS